MSSWLKKIRFSLCRFAVAHSGAMDLAKIHPVPSWFNTISQLFKRLLVDERPLQSALFGPISFQVIRSSVNVGLIKLLDERPGLSLPMIAEALNLEAYAVHVLLIGLASLKLVVKMDDKYYLDPFLSQMLLDRVNDGFGPKYLAFAHHLIAPALTQLEKSVRTGQPQGLKHVFGDSAGSFYEELANNDHLNAYFEPVMRQLSGVNENRVAGMRAWSDRSRVLDVGGGSGGLAMALARHQLRLSVTVLDFPAVVTATAKTFAATPEAARLEAIGGNLNAQVLPNGYDAIVFSHFLDIFSEHEAVSYLRRAFDALPDGGRVCIFTPVITDDETGPFTNALLCSYFLCLANGRGRFYSAATLVHFLHLAKFVDISTTKLPMNEVAVFAVKGFT